jgi:hypothetical protein
MPYGKTNLDLVKRQRRSAAHAKKNPDAVKPVAVPATGMFAPPVKERNPDVQHMIASFEAKKAGKPIPPAPPKSAANGHNGVSARAVAPAPAARPVPKLAPTPDKQSPKAAGLRKIDVAAFAKIGPLPLIEPGPMPHLRFIEIDQLVIDPTYQREISSAKGRKNITKIAREFEWARFSPVIVAPSKEKFAIIDGQHRTTAAALRGHKKVPCQVVGIDVRKQAAAFAAINANVTEMSSIQVHAALVAAEDPGALRLEAVCASANVKILPYPVQSNKMKVGETLAVRQLQGAMERYGKEPLRVALCAITKTRDGNPGMVRGQLVQALCQVLEPNKALVSNPKTIALFEQFDFRKVWADAGKEAMMSRGKIISVLAARISKFLEKVSA